MRPGPTESERLSTVRADLVQLDILLKEAVAKLAAGFVGAHEALRRQQALAAPAGPEARELTREACAHLDSALTALQFEDIASQLIASARHHLSDGGDMPGRGSNRSVPQHHMESGDIEFF